MEYPIDGVYMGDCPLCRGTGRIGTRDYQADNGTWETMDIDLQPCHLCHGTGTTEVFVTGYVELVP